MSETQTQEAVVETVANAEVVDGAQLDAAAAEAQQAQQLDSLKQLVGIPFENAVKDGMSDVEAKPVTIDPMEKLAALKKANEEPKAEEKEPEAQKELESEPTKEEAKAEPAKPLELKDYVETLENTKVLHKIDGEMVEVDLKEAVKEVLNKVSGVKFIEKKITELDKREKMIHNTKQEQDNVVKNFDKFIESGDIIGGYAYIGSLTGKPAYQIKEQLIAAITPIVEQRYALSQEQIDLERLKEENDYLSQVREAESRKSKEAQTIQERELEITKLRETHKIDEDTWNEAFNALDQELPQDEPITKEMVLERAQSKLFELQTVSVVQPIVQKFNLNKEDEAVLVGIAKQYPKFTSEDIEAVVRESLQIQSNQDVEKKLAGKYSEQQTNKPLTEDESQKELLRLKKLAGLVDQY